MENNTYKGYSLISACKSCINKYVTFTGRATRSEYWYWTLAMMLVGLVVGIFNIVMVKTIGINSSILPLLINLFLLLPGLAVTVRRLHDTGRSGWFILVNLIPLIGWLIFLYFTVQDSQRGTNKYGNSEKYPDLEETPQQ